jgi:hypothetical protein
MQMKFSTHEERNSHTRAQLRRENQRRGGDTTIDPCVRGGDTYVCHCVSRQL